MGNTYHNFISDVERAKREYKARQNILVSEPRSLYKLKAFIGVTLLLFIMPFFVSAQISDTTISVGLSPENPGAFQEVTISLESFVISLDKARMVWTVDGKTRLSGIGEKELTLTTNNVGDITTIRVQITTDTGTNITKTILIEPNEIDLLWEAPDSYTPPFYKGKALPSSESKIKVVAIPHMQKNSSLAYTWKRNFKIISPASGFGKRSYTFTHDFINREENISVEASALTNAIQGTGSIRIRPDIPKIVFYENHPIEGIHYNRALTDGFSLNKNEFTLIAEPYFFSAQNAVDSNLRYEWSLNNESIATPEDKNSLFLRLEGGQEGTSALSLSIKSISKLFQSTISSIEIILGF